MILVCTDHLLCTIQTSKVYFICISGKKKGTSQEINHLTFSFPTETEG